MMLRLLAVSGTVPDATQAYVAPKNQTLLLLHRQGQFNVKKRWQGKTIDVHTGTIDNVWRLIKGSLPRIFTRRVLGIQLCSMARFDACSRLAVEMGKQFPQKPLQAHCRNCEEHFAQKKESAAEVFYISSEKYARTFKEIELSGRCKTTVICGIKSMTNTANVENAGSINNPPGSLSRHIWYHKNPSLRLSKLT